ncbi:hypothetical protein TrCOL_g6959 [Triparma columacea]|uniref:peptidyl-tRNA hydrolase n=1 Tax=Triparma columacea TaxID=722753 RepID=A0A9W7LDK2_9STRA|nr:hypothetical protein TrCOL_g6959 [Triparma columacea]
MLSSSIPLVAATGVASAVFGYFLCRYTTPEPADFDDEDYDSDDHVPVPSSADPTKWGVASAPYKMVLAVNKSLKMGNGKIAAQCCHAAVGCYKRAKKAYPAGLRAWEYTGCAKVAVKIQGEKKEVLEQFSEITRKCRELGVAYYLVEDAGRTQIEPGSKTVIGVGPGPVDIVDQITSEFKLM